MTYNKSDLKPAYTWLDLAKDIGAGLFFMACVLTMLFEFFIMGV